MGYSLGGGVATFVAIRYPELIRKAVIISVNFTRKAIYPEMLAQQEQVGPEAAEALKQTPMYQLYASIAPRPEDWPRLLGRIGAAMKGDFDYSKEIATIKAPTLIVSGDSEMYPPTHAAESSDCSAVASKTAAGMARAARNRVWRSFPGRPTTRSSRHPGSPR